MFIRFVFLSLAIVAPQTILATPADDFANKIFPDCPKGYTISITSEQILSTHEGPLLLEQRENFPQLLFGDLSQLQLSKPLLNHNKKLCQYSSNLPNRSEQTSYNKEIFKLQKELIRTRDNLIKAKMSLNFEFDPNKQYGVGYDFGGFTIDYQYNPNTRNGDYNLAIKPTKQIIPFYGGIETSSISAHNQFTIDPNTKLFLNKTDVKLKNARMLCPQGGIEINNANVKIQQQLKANQLIDTTITLYIQKVTSQLHTEEEDPKNPEDPKVITHTYGPYTPIHIEVKMSDINSKRINHNNFSTNILRLDGFMTNLLMAKMMDELDPAFQQFIFFYNTMFHDTLGEKIESSMTINTPNGPVKLTIDIDNPHQLPWRKQLPETRIELGQWIMKFLSTVDATLEINGNSQSIDDAVQC